MNVYYSIFPVHDKPHCVWSHDLHKENLEFLKAVDPQFFKYLAEVHGRNVTDKTDKQAAVALRLAYLHGLETLFTLLAGTLQAPDALFAWVTRCRTPDLHRIVQDIDDKNQSMLRMLEIKEVSWHGLSQLINNFKLAEGLPDPVETFAQLWARLAHQFLADTNRLELNSLKHGFRVRFGSASISWKSKEGHEVNLKPGDFGTGFFYPEQMLSPCKGNFYLRRANTNWDPRILVNSLAVIAASINNITAFLRVRNGDDPASIQGHYPISGNSVEAITKSEIQIFKLDIKLTIPRDIKAFTEAEMMDRIRKVMESNRG